MASNATEPTPTVDPALEAVASALRADLAARGIPADELPEAVVLALAVQDLQIRLLLARVDSLEFMLMGARTVRGRDVSDEPEPVRRMVEWLEAARRQVQDAGRLWLRVPDMRDFLSPTVPPSEAPRFRHDCSDCTFLGRSADGARDLYYIPAVGGAPDLLLIRYGDADSDVSIGGPYVAEAHRRAVARGLIDGAGEGG